MTSKLSHVAAHDELACVYRDILAQQGKVLEEEMDREQAVVSAMHAALRPGLEILHNALTLVEDSKEREALEPTITLLEGMAVDGPLTVHGGLISGAGEDGT